MVSYSVICMYTYINTLSADPPIWDSQKKRTIDVLLGDEDVRVPCDVCANPKAPKSTYKWHFSKGHVLPPNVSEVRHMFIFTLVDRYCLIKQW